VRTRALRVGQWLGLTIGVLLALAIVSIGVALVVNHRLSHSRHVVLDQVEPALQASLRLENGLINQETGVRGFLLTGERQFLQPFYMGHEAEKRAYDALRAQARVAPSHLLSELEAVRRRAHAWRLEFVEPALRRQRHEGPLLAQSTLGKERFDAVRVALAGLEGDLEHKLATSHSQLEHEASELQAVLFVAGGLIVASTGGCTPMNAIASTPSTPLSRPIRTSGLLARARDVSVLTARNLVHIAREPLQLSDVTVQPVLFTLLFVYVFGAGVVLPDGGSYTSFAIAGLLALNLTTSSMGTAVGLSTDLGSGVIDRFRTLAMWRPAVLVGRTLADVLTAAICSAFVAVTGLIVGWRPEGSVLETLGGFGVFLLFSYALSWGCACLGMLSKGPESAQSIGLVVVFPLAIVSNALVPTEHMPAVLRAIADWNPVSAVTAAARDLFHNPNPSAHIHAWPMQHPALAALAWSVLLIAVFAPLASHLYKRRTTD
jgi:ABC-2 type transport system permease protein